MDKRTIDSLITELELLRLCVGRLESEANEREQLTANEVNERRRQLAIDSERVTPIGLVRGDRVRITNHIRRPAVWPSTVAWDEETKKKERSATVTHIYKEQVHLVTDNGTKTWRAPNNLRKC